MSPRRLPQRPVFHWLLLGLPLALLLLGAATFDRAGGPSPWPTVFGDEATYLMQAESLAFDLDLEYSRADFDRFVRHWGVEPEGLILQKGERDDDLVYGKPFFYAVWAAPFVRLSPTRGPFVANALLLALAAVATAVALRGTLGATAPAWAALVVFASVTFAHVFWAHLDLYLLCSTALGLALAFGEPGGRSSSSGSEGAATPGPSPPARVLPWAAAGLLLASVVYARPLYAAVLLPAVVAAWRRDRRRALGALAAGALVLTLGTLLVQQNLVGSWTSYGAERRSFGSATGFPEVDLPDESWDEMIDRWGNASWTKREGLTGLSLGTPRLWGWNTLYFLAGESVGFLPYLLPGLLGFVTWRRRRPGPARLALAAAVLLTALGFFVLRPFNFYGGGGALANRYILPVYAALWFVPTRPLRGGWLAGTALLAAPFLWPLWSAPRAYPLDADGLFRHVSPVARTLLPYETTQSHMRPTGVRVNVRHGGLWVKSLTPAVWTEGGGARFRFDPEEGTAVLLVGDERPLEALHLELEHPVPPPRIEGGRITGGTPLDSGGTRLWIELDGPRARHPMWWVPDEDFFLYTLRIELSPELVEHHEPIPFTLAPAAR